MSKAVSYVVYKNKDVEPTIRSAQSLREIYKAKKIPFDIILMIGIYTDGEKLLNKKAESNIPDSLSAVARPLFDKIIPLEEENILKLESYIQYKHDAEKYKDRFLPTKFNVFLLEGYDKILYLNPTVIISGVIDSCFNFNTPAFPLTITKKDICTPKDILDRIYTMSKESAIDGKIFLISPNKKIFDSYKKFVRYYNSPAGYPELYNFSDEITFMEFCIKDNINIYNLPHTNIETEEKKHYDKKPWKPRN